MSEGVVTHRAQAECHSTAAMPAGNVRGVHIPQDCRSKVQLSPVAPTHLRQRAPQRAHAVPLPQPRLQPLLVVRVALPRLHHHHHHAAWSRKQGGLRAG